MELIMQLGNYNPNILSFSISDHFATWVLYLKLLSQHNTFQVEDRIISYSDYSGQFFDYRIFWHKTADVWVFSLYSSSLKIQVIWTICMIICMTEGNINLYGEYMPRREKFHIKCKVNTE